MPDQNNPIEVALRKIYHRLISSDLPVSSKDMQSIRETLVEFQTIVKSHEAQTDK